jgi:hypothetical protein
LSPKKKKPPEEKIQATESVMIGDESELSCLISNPKSDDEILFAMWVCAPWTALHNYKYKVKVVPGPAGKKSKVAAQCCALFAKQAEATPREAVRAKRRRVLKFCRVFMVFFKELIKAIPEEEILHLLPANSRLLLPGVLTGKGNAQRKKGGAKRKGANKRANRNK